MNPRWRAAVVALGLATATLLLALLLLGGQHRSVFRPPASVAIPTTPPPRPPSEVLPAIGASLNNVFNTAGVSDGAVARQVGAARAAGVRLARSDAFWEASEPAPPRRGVHTYDWRFDDRVAGFVARSGMHWLPIIDYAPRWAAADASVQHSPPRSDDDYAAYARAFARRYGRGGEWWRLQPRLRYLPVTTYEVWNEENSSLFWAPTAAEPGRYADLYMHARAAIRGVDPVANVIVGGLAEPAWPFIEAMVAARPALHGAIDGVGVHPYAKSPAGVLANVRLMRRALHDVNEASVPIYVTEIGWATSPTTSAKYAPSDVRATNIVTTVSRLLDSDCGVATVIVYTWISPERSPSDDNDWYGIYHPGGGQTTSSRALAKLLRARAAGPAKHALRVCHP